MSDKNLKLYFIHDPVEAVADFTRDLVLTQQFGDTSFERRGSISNATSPVLFGDILPVVVKADTKEEVAAVFDELTALIKTGSLEKVCAHGVIVTGSGPLTSFNRLIKVADKIGAPVYRRDIVRGKDDKTAENLIRQFLKLSNSRVKFLVDYIGSDYVQLLPLIRALRNVPESEQSRLTEEDLFFMLPRPEGAVPSYRIDKPIFETFDAVELTKTYKRISEAGVGEFLMLVKYLENKFVYLVKLSSAKNINEAREMVLKLTGKASRSYYTDNLVSYSRKFSQEALIDALNVVATARSDVRGGSALDSHILFELALLKVMNVLALDIKKRR